MDEVFEKVMADEIVQEALRDIEPTEDQDILELLRNYQGPLQ
jgi:ribosomal protein S7